MDNNAIAHPSGASDVDPRTAIDHGFINYPVLSEGAVFLESVRAEPEFQALMALLKPRWEALVEWERGSA